MSQRIEIVSTVPDTRATVRKHLLEQTGLRESIRDLFIVDVYTIDTQLTKSQYQRAVTFFSNPVTQNLWKHTAPLPFSWAIEIGFLPGVTDNVGATAKEAIEDLLRVKFSPDEHVYSSQLTCISGNLSQKDAQLVAQHLSNPLIQRSHIKSYRQFVSDKGMGNVVPKVLLQSTACFTPVDVDVSDDVLTVIGKQGIANGDGTRRGPLALDLMYMKAIQAYFCKQGRLPTDVELESIAQTWSQHCKHTIFADPIDDISEGLYRRYIKGATNAIRKKKGKKDICVSVFTDNSGAISFDRRYLITDKVETHNSPSALDPFGGAITGIGGVNRDALGFGLGAKPVANQYGFCFADPHMPSSQLYRNTEEKQPMLPPRRIMDGVVAGVNAGGNCSGIPTLDGFLYFDSRYQGKPLVFVGTVGLIPRRVAGKVSYRKKARPGDYIVMVGGRVGADGIHGATFSSEAMDMGSPKAAVQIGDPITQKKFSDALAKEARDLGLYTSITDNGAGGLSCSVAEMAKESGGCLVELAHVPLKYPGLSPWQIWISESQERMTLAVAKRKWKRLANLLARRGVEATVIGTFTDSGRCIVRFANETVMDIEMEFLHNGVPPRPMRTKQPARTISAEIYPAPKNITGTIHDLLTRPSVAGFSFVSEQFDHTVQGGAVLGPLQGRGRVNAQATVFRPVLSSPKGVVLSHGLCPSYSDYDTYHMAACAIDSAIRAAVAAGADPDRIALLDNFCWCSATDPERLFELKRASQACYDYAVAYGTPFIAGKDSMFNDFHGYDAKGKPVTISIPPTLLISALSVMDDHTQAVSLDAKLPGDLVYLLGNTHEELGGSEYYRMRAEVEKLHGLRGSVPQVEAARNQKAYRAFHQAIHAGYIASAISASCGGLAVALAKTAIGGTSNVPATFDGGGMMGMDIALDAIKPTLRADHLLFSESQGRIVATVAPENKNAFEKTMKGTSCALIGAVTEKPQMTISLNGKRIVETTVQALHQAHTKTFAEY